MKKFPLMFLLVMAAGLVSAAAQSRFVEGRNSAFGVEAGFSGNEDATSIGAGVGFSISGNIDLSASIRRINLDATIDGADVSANAFSLGFAFFPLKQNAEVPLSLGAGLGFANYVSDALDYYGWDMTATVVSFGITRDKRL